MKRNQIARDDFPEADNGYDRGSVNAHLAAVAAWTAALEAQIAALEVERDALRKSAVRSAEQVAEAPAGPEATQAAAAEPAIPETTEPGGTEDEPETASSEDEVSARLVATRLSLEGSGREEIVAVLEGRYQLEDPAGLVEDVLTRLA